MAAPKITFVLNQTERIVAAPLAALPLTTVMTGAPAKYERTRLKSIGVAINDGGTSSGINGVVINDGGARIDIGIGVAIDASGASQI